MNALKHLFFPRLCHRCHSPTKQFLCNLCLLGVELAPYNGGNVAFLFDGSMNFLHKNRVDYQKMIQSFTLIQLTKLRWTFSHIECEPELIHLKTFLLKNVPQKGEKILFLLHRKNNPILKVPIYKRAYVLIV
jgi:hypothetical protein